MTRKKNKPAISLWQTNDRNNSSDSIPQPVNLPDTLPDPLW